MNKNAKIFKIIGWILLSLFALVIVKPAYFLYIISSLKLCSSWECVSFLLYSPFILLFSVISFLVSRLLSKKSEIKKDLSNTRSNNSLLMRLTLGIILITTGFLFYKLKYDGIDLIISLVGLFFIASSVIQMVVNYLKKPKF